MPNLYVVAGPNGAGKSSNNELILPIQSFDYDLILLNYLAADPNDHEFKEEFARQRTFELLENSIKKAISKKMDFAYETNFHDPAVMYWPNIFKKAGYNTHLYFVALQAVELCQIRVDSRVKMGGHYVSFFDIAERFKGGLKNCNTHFRKFDSFKLLDNTQGEMKVYCILDRKISASKSRIQYDNFIVQSIPFKDWMKKDFRKIYQFINR